MIMKEQLLRVESTWRTFITEHMAWMQAAAVVGADNASMATMDAHAVLDLLSLQPQQLGAAATGSATGT